MFQKKNTKKRVEKLKILYKLKFSHNKLLQQKVLMIIIKYQNQVNQKCKKNKKD